MDTNFSPEQIEAAKTDTHLFAEIFHRYAPQLFSYVASRVSVREDAEEITGQVWEQIVKHFPKFKPLHEGSFPGWIFRIAKNRLTDFYRKKKLKTVSLEKVVHIAPAKDDSRTLVERQERFLAIRDLINKLPRKQKGVVELKYFADLKNKEIAVALKVDERTVASNLSRAIKRMRNDLDDHAVKLFSERCIE